MGEINYGDRNCSFFCTKLYFCCKVECFNMGVSDGSHAFGATITVFR